MRTSARQNQVYSADFQPQGERLATCGGDVSVRLWRCSTGPILITKAPKMSPNAKCRNMMPDDGAAPRSPIPCSKPMDFVYLAELLFQNSGILVAGNRCIGRKNVFSSPENASHNKVFNACSCRKTINGSIAEVRDVPDSAAEVRKVRFPSSTNRIGRRY